MTLLKSHSLSSNGDVFNKKRSVLITQSSKNSIKKQMRVLNTKFQEMMNEYTNQTKKKIEYGIKISKKFINWIQKHASRTEIEKNRLIEYCEIYEQQIPTIKLREMQKIAEKWGGICEAIEYINATTKLQFKCKEGHAWKALPSNIKTGHWCPKCRHKEGGSKLRSSINELNDYVTQHHPGGKCEATKYVNNRTKLPFRCEKGHFWNATPSNIKKGRWCPKCGHTAAGNKLKASLGELQEIARQRGGECTATEYINDRTKLPFRCKKGHTWNTTPTHIKRGQWCPKCRRKEVGIRRRLSIEEIKEIAKQRGGECESKVYVNNRTKLKFRCKKGHTWKATPDKIKRGQWCAVCSEGVSERFCRKIFETVFNKAFPKARPKWLVNDRTNQMELDGYNEELGLAFEYQGIQHYEYVAFFHQCKKDLERRKRDDKKKRLLCNQKDVILIEIPYTIQKKLILEYIIKQFEQKKIIIPRSIDNIEYEKLLNQALGRIKTKNSLPDAQKQIAEFLPPATAKAENFEMIK